MNAVQLLPFVLLVVAAPAAAAQHWKVDYARSKVGFTVSWSGQPFTAVFRRWKADIDFDPADLAHARADISIETGSESSGDSDTDEGVKGVEGFAASQFPTARFHATAFTRKSGNEYVAAGALSIKGISRPIALPFTLKLNGGTAHVTGKTELTRTDFHVGTGEWEKPDPVARGVTVNVNLVASKG